MGVGAEERRELVERGEGVEERVGDGRRVERGDPGGGGGEVQGVVRVKI